MTNPGIGEIVHYGCDPCLAAIVVEIPQAPLPEHEGRAGLTIFMPIRIGGGTVSQYVDYGPKSESTWHWPCGRSSLPETFGGTSILPCKGTE